MKLCADGERVRLGVAAARVDPHTLPAFSISALRYECSHRQVGLVSNFALLPNDDRSLSEAARQVKADQAETVGAGPLRTES